MYAKSIELRIYGTASGLADYWESLAVENGSGFADYYNSLRALGGRRRGNRAAAVARRWGFSETSGSGLVALRRLKGFLGGNESFRLSFIPKVRFSMVFRRH